MDEIEVKVIGIDPEAMMRKIERLGGRKLFDGGLVTIFFDTPDGRIARAKDLLRLRCAGDGSTLTYKRYVSDAGAKVRREYEICVDDFETTRKVLGLMGFVETHLIRKRRTSYTLGDARIELDRHEGEHSFIPPFLEIEVRGKDQLEGICKSLGIQMKQVKPWTFFDIVRHYKKRNAQRGVLKGRGRSKRAKKR
jgi:adenylate cyclase class 2